MRRSTLALVALSVVIGGASGLSQDGQAGEYLLGPMDRLRIKVIEWRAGKGEYYDWAALSGEYVIDASGNVSIPLLGPVVALGGDTTSLADTIADKLKDRAGLPTSPDVSIEVVQHRPIYIAGDVDKPGEYSFRPGLTVIKAMALAGGNYRSGDGLGGQSIFRDQIRAVGTADSSRIELQRLMMRRARLRSEMTNEDAFLFPEELTESETTKRLFEDETRILRARNAMLRSRMTSLRDLKVLVESEIATLESKQAKHGKQVKIAGEEKERVNELFAKGLTVATRRISVERDATEIESRMLDIGTALLRAKEEASKTDRALLDLQAEQQTKLVLDLETVESDIDQNTSKLLTAQRLMDDATRSGLTLASTKTDGADEAPNNFKYFITRRDSEGKSQSLAADENTELEPGDVVKIVVNTAKSAGGSVDTVSATDNIKIADRPSIVKSILHQIGSTVGMDR